MNIQFLQNLLDEKIIEIHKQMDELSSLVTLYNLTKTQDEQSANKFRSAYIKTQYLDTKIKDLNEVKKLIKNLKHKALKPSIENCLNPYGLFIDRQYYYYNNEFEKLDNQKQAHIFIVELINSYQDYTKKRANYENEILMTLSHLGFVKELPYARSKRNKLTNEYLQKYNELPILFQSNINARNHILEIAKKEKTELFVKLNKNGQLNSIYKFTNQTMGWKTYTSENNICNETKKETIINEFDIKNDNLNYIFNNKLNEEFLKLDKNTKEYLTKHPQKELEIKNLVIKSLIENCIKNELNNTINKLNI